MQVIGNSWDEILEKEYGKPYFSQLTEAVERDYAEKTVYPQKPEI